MDWRSLVARFRLPAWITWRRSLRVRYCTVSNYRGHGDFDHDRLDHSRILPPYVSRCYCGSPVSEEYIVVRFIRRRDDRHRAGEWRDCPPLTFDKFKQLRRDPNVDLYLEPVLSPKKGWRRVTTVERLAARIDELETQLWLQPQHPPNDNGGYWNQLAACVYEALLLVAGQEHEDEMTHFLSERVPRLLARKLGIPDGLRYADPHTENLPTGPGGGRGTWRRDAHDRLFAAAFALGFPRDIAYPHPLPLLAYFEGYYYKMARKLGGLRYLGKRTIGAWRCNGCNQVFPLHLGVCPNGACAPAYANWQRFSDAYAMISQELSESNPSEQSQENAREYRTLLLSGRPACPRADVCAPPAERPVRQPRQGTAVAHLLEDLLHRRDFAGIGNLTLTVLSPMHQETNPDEDARLLEREAPGIVSLAFSFPPGEGFPNVYRDSHLPHELHGVWTFDAYVGLFITAYLLGATVEPTRQPHAMLVPFYRLMAKRQREALPGVRAFDVRDAARDLLQDVLAELKMGLPPEAVAQALETKLKGPAAAKPSRIISPDDL